jgi:hypothetical protein
MLSSQDIISAVTGGATAAYGSTAFLKSTGSTSAAWRPHGVHAATPAAAAPTGSTETASLTAVANRLSVDNVVQQV